MTVFGHVVQGALWEGFLETFGNFTVFLFGLDAPLDRAIPLGGTYPSFLRLVQIFPNEELR